MTDKPPFAPLDLSALRIQPTADLVPTERILTNVPIRKPGRTEFVRVSPDPAHRFPCLLFEDPEDRDVVFLIPPGILAAAAVEIPVKRVELRLAITRGGSRFLWRVPLPDPHGRTIGWHTSAAEAAQLAETRWVRMTANMGAGHYDLTAAAGEIPDPDWHSLPPFEDLLRIATKGRVVDSPEHLILRRLRGEV